MNVRVILRLGCGFGLEERCHASEDGYFVNLVSRYGGCVSAVPRYAVRVVDGRCRFACYDEAVILGDLAHERFTECEREVVLAVGKDVECVGSKIVLDLIVYFF